MADRIFMTQSYLCHTLAMVGDTSTDLRAQIQLNFQRVLFAYPNTATQQVV